MKKVSIISAEEAALKVQDGDTIATGGFVSCACPETLSKALEKRFLETGHPNNLTLFFAAGQGHRDGTGGDHRGQQGGRRGFDRRAEGVPAGARRGPRRRGEADARLTTGGRRESWAPSRGRSRG